MAKTGIPGFLLQFFLCREKTDLRGDIYPVMLGYNRWLCKLSMTESKLWRKGTASLYLLRSIREAIEP